MAPVGLERQVIRLLVAHPALSADLDDAALQAIGRLAPDRAQMLTQLVEVSRSMGEQANFASLVEHLRDAGPDFEALIAEIAAETESEFDVVRQEMAGAVRQTKMRQVEDEMQQLATGGMRDDVARQRYRELMQQKEYLKRLSGAEFG